MPGVQAEGKDLLCYRDYPTVHIYPLFSPSPRAPTGPADELSPPAVRPLQDRLPPGTNKKATLELVVLTLEILIMWWLYQRTCCEPNRIDLSQGAFKHLADLSEGEIEIDWNWSSN
ncbi:hypothetical protein D9758_011820 [Tetrapyrgos nigripes]|uniref:Uncharacterized protein n=1 Tax=Tetrapyrgos nigripes TaxID=182062 RepID=A0A8H5CMP4_9AGAR|nr:hypothetical protein D9758_011820 [Tetrapyrgos nigripes]